MHIIHALLPCLCVYCARVCALQLDNLPMTEQQKREMSGSVQQ